MSDGKASGFWQQWKKGISIFLGYLFVVLALAVLFVSVPLQRDRTATEHPPKQVWARPETGEMEIVRPSPLELNVHWLKNSLGFEDESSGEGLR